MMVAAAIIFGFHVTAKATLGLPNAWNMTYITIYPACFVASLILAITRMMNVIPNPKPIIPVTISLVGWSAMLTGGILAMRHSGIHIHIAEMTDDEIAASPIFRHDLTICSLSLVGSSLYLVHAWLCYDCWWWEKKQKELREAGDSTQASVSGAESTSEDETPSSKRQSKHRSNSSVIELPSTSERPGKSPENLSRKSTRTCKLLEKLRGTSKTKQEEIDPFVTLNEILRRSVQLQQTTHFPVILPTSLTEEYKDSASGILVSQESRFGNMNDVQTYRPKYHSSVSIACKYTRRLIGNALITIVGVMYVNEMFFIRLIEEVSLATALPPTYMISFVLWLLRLCAVTMYYGPFDIANMIE